MSIFQEYEEIKMDIGETKWNALNLYLLDRKGILLSNVLYNEKEWEKFDNWYNKTLRNRKVKVLNCWNTDYGDIAFSFIMYQGKNPIVNSIQTISSNVLYGSNTDEKIIKSIEKYVYLNFEKFTELPKISKCSKLLQEIYDSVCESDASMCHITEEDWQEYYKERYTEKDLEKLKEEVQKYNLDDVIGLYDGEYKIVGYENLSISFNDDRSFNKNKDKEAR